MTVVTTIALVPVPLLFVAIKSSVEEVLEIVFVKVADSDGADKVSVKLVAAPLVNVIAGQVTAPLLLEPPPVALTKRIPDGNTSLTTTFEAVDGPAFVTEMV